MTSERHSDILTIVRPAAQTLPVVVDVPHAGEWIPEAVAAELVVGDQVLRRDLDLYVDQLWEAAPRLGATLIVSKVSRYVVDLNRAGDDVSGETVVGAQAIERPGYYGDRGVVWRTTTDGTPVMAGPMTQDAFARRIAAYHSPYHDAIEAELERVKAQFGFAILIDGHSMPSLGRRGHTDAGALRADIVPGDLDGAACSSALRRIVVDTYREHGYRVAPNEPYKGGWITRRWGRPRDHLHAIQIEVNRRLYMDEATFKIKRQGIERLRAACEAILPQLDGWRP